MPKIQTVNKFQQVYNSLMPKFLLIKHKFEEKNAKPGSGMSEWIMIESCITALTTEIGHWVLPDSILLRKMKTSRFLKIIYI